MSTETTQELAAKSGLAVTEITRPRKSDKVPRWVNFTETVDVEVSADDLHEMGWHHENECKAGVRPVPVPEGEAAVYVTTTAALESLHKQAHGAVPIALCRAEPCASLSLDQLWRAA
jgi:hypothetical protein